MNYKIVDVIKKFVQDKQDLNLIIQYLGDICILNTRIKKISLTISDNDYWNEPCIFGGYTILDDKTLAWDIQFNSKIMCDENFTNLLIIMNKIFDGKEIIEQENVIKKMPGRKSLLKD